MATLNVALFFVACTAAVAVILEMSFFRGRRWARREEERACARARRLG